MIDPQSSREWAPFDKDVAHNEGYLYTTNPSLSSCIAAQRHSDAIFATVDFSGKCVIDIGCGDGTYSVELYDRGKPCSIFALDPAPKAIEVARQRIGGRNITCTTESAYYIPCSESTFDIAYLRGVLHHMDRPFDALKEALRVASTIVVLEPNGYNIALKVIEKMSRYHREHGEKSYPPFKIDRWVHELGARVSSRDWMCLVPFFCPDWFARAMRSVEPLVEATPLVNRVACGAYLMVASKEK